MAQDLHAIEAAGDFRAHAALPTLTRGPIGATDIFAPRRVVKLEERRPTILRMQLVALVALLVDVVGKAHAERLRALCAGLRIIAVKDEHVAAATLRELQEPAGGGCCADRGYDLKEPIGSDREDHVLKAVLGDAAVAVACRKAQQGTDERRGCLQMRSGEADLTQPQIRSHVSGPRTRACVFRQMPLPLPCGRPSRRTGCDCVPPDPSIGRATRRQSQAPGSL